MAVTTSGAEVTKNYLRFAGIKYYRRNAPRVTLVSWGKKMTPLGGQFYLEPQGSERPPAPKILKVARLSMEWDKTTSREILASLSPAALKLAGASVSAAQELNDQGKLELLMISVESGQLKKHINGQKRFLSTLKEADNDARLANIVFVIVEAEFAAAVDTSAGASLAATIKGITLSATGSQGSSGTSTTTIGADAGFAYGLVKPEWDAPSKRNRTKVVSFTPDPHN